MFFQKQVIYKTLFRFAKVESFFLSAIFYLKSNHLNNPFK